MSRQRKKGQAPFSLLNRGPVIKINSNQRYATSSETAAQFRHLCQQLGIPVQSFVTRSDMAAAPP